MLKDVHEGLSGKITTYGSNKLPCSTGIYDSPWIILVEGRADILNLLRAGYDNALAIEGAKIDETIKDLCAKKDKVVAFLDGDRAGGFILKELKSVVNIDLELRADEGVEVEELTREDSGSGTLDESDLNTVQELVINLTNSSGENKKLIIKFTQE